MALVSSSLKRPFELLRLESKSQLPAIVPAFHYFISAADLVLAEIQH